MLENPPPVRHRDSRSAMPRRHSVATRTGAYGRSGRFTGCSPDHGRSPASTGWKHSGPSCGRRSREPSSLVSSVRWWTSSNPSPSRSFSAAGRKSAPGPNATCPRTPGAGQSARATRKGLRPRGLGSAPAPRPRGDGRTSPARTTVPCRTDGDRHPGPDRPARHPSSSTTRPRPNTWRNCCVHWSQSRMKAADVVARVPEEASEVGTAARTMTPLATAGP